MRVLGTGATGYIGGRIPRTAPFRSHGRTSITMTSRVILLAALSVLIPGELMAYEEPRYTVVRESDGFELRRYDPYIVAEIDVDGEFEDAGSVAFGPLAGYIFGRNRAEEKIGMTAPVTQRTSGETIGMTAPVTQRPGEGRGYVLSFVMPSRYTMDTLPRPVDPRIRIRQVPGALRAVRKYRGGWGEKRYRAEERKLMEAVTAANLKPLASPSWARYNSPYWPPPPFRRNEILVDVRQP